MSFKKFRWSKVYESTEEELADFLTARRIVATRWSLDMLDTAETRTVDHATSLWCAEGSLTVVSDGHTMPLQPGDGLDMPSGSTFAVNAGISGCVCYESASPTGIPS